jgi:hypothetical protein
MTVSKLFILALAAATSAHADFSYNTTSKGPAMPGGNMDQSTKHYLKGDKMMTDTGNSAMIIDFDAQTVTHINKTNKTYSVSKVSDLTSGQGPEAKAEMSADFKETGQHKTINGFNASQAMMTMQMDMPQQGQQPGMKIEMEMELWLSPDVPGYSEMEAFYKRNMSRFPWAAMAQGSNPSMRATMAELQRKMAAMHGAPVLQIVRTKMGGAGAPTMTPQQQAQMDKAKAQIEAMQKQGGPQAAAAAQMMARMNAMSGGGGGGMEITMESSGFSAASIPDSVFAIPAGYQQTTK